MDIQRWLLRIGRLKPSESTSYMDRRRASLPPAGTFSRAAEKRIKDQREPNENYLKGLGVENGRS